MTNTATLTAPTNVLVLPINRLELRVSTASEGYDGYYSTRYVSDETRRALEDAAIEAAVRDESVKKAQQRVLAQVEIDAEYFFEVMGGEENESFDGSAYGTTTDLESIRTFAAANVGMTLEQLINGCWYEGGVVIAQLDRMLEETYEAEDFDCTAKEYELIEASIKNYRLQADGTFVFTA